MTKPVILEIQKALALEYQTKYKWASGIGHWGRTICVHCENSIEDGKESYINNPDGTPSTVCKAGVDWQGRQMINAASVGGMVHSPDKVCIHWKLQKHKIP